MNRFLSFFRFSHDVWGEVDYINSMETVLPYLLGAAMFATLAVLVTGIISFAVHGDFYLRHANHLMRMRLIMQGIAVAIFARIVFLTVL